MLKAAPSKEGVFLFTEENMLLNQDIEIDGNNVKLRNTIDIGMAKSLAKDQTAEGGERSSNMKCIGHIPPEMWAFDPWLKEASKARYFGDMQNYTKYLMKFFDVHPCFRVENGKKYFNLGGAY